MTPKMPATSAPAIAAIICSERDMRDHQPPLFPDGEEPPPLFSYSPIPLASPGSCTLRTLPSSEPRSPRDHQGHSLLPTSCGWCARLSTPSGRHHRPGTCSGTFDDAGRSSSVAPDSAADTAWQVACGRARRRCIAREAAGRVRLGHEEFGAGGDAELADVILGFAGGGQHLAVLQLGEGVEGTRDGHAAGGGGSAGGRTGQNGGQQPVAGGTVLRAWLTAAPEPPRLLPPRPGA
jgi:hypothetical protein